MATAVDAKLVIGKIVGLFGVEAWLKLESYAEPRTQIFKYKPWFLSVPRPDGERNEEIQFESAHGRVQGKGIVARLAGIETRDAAAGLIGAEIRINRSALPRPARGEYYWADLEGLSVVNLQGISFGHVSHLFSTGANDVVVTRDSNGRERMVPFLSETYVHEIDIAAGRIVVDWDADF